jgi:hypothetical protein
MVTNFILREKKTPYDSVLNGLTHEEQLHVIRKLNIENHLPTIDFIIIINKSDDR